MHPSESVIDLSLRVPADQRAPALARRVLLSLLEGAIDPRLIETGRLLVSELVTNSVRHGGIAPPQQVGLRVRVRAGSSLRVEVSDDGNGYRPPGHVDNDGGHGLVLLAEMAERWGVEPGPPTCFWFELDPAPQHDRGERLTRPTAGYPASRRG